MKHIEIDVITKVRISFLRQWLNEDRITDPKKMVTDKELAYWLFDMKDKPKPRERYSKG